MVTTGTNKIPELWGQGKRPVLENHHLNGAQDGSSVGNQGISRATIPLILLALAKDERYLQRGAELLKEMVNGWGVSVSPGLCKVVATTLFCSPLIPWKESRPNKTIGMASCEVDFSNKTDGTKLALCSIALTVLICAVENYQATCQLAPKSTTKNENLKGKSRIETFEQQRKEMIDRLGANRNPLNPVDRKSRIRMWPQEILEACITAFKAATSVPPGFGGPHMRRGDESWEINASSSILWLIRLHAALYLLYGKYPTVLHRVLRLRFQSKSPMQRETEVRTDSYDLEYGMGVLLGGISLGSLFELGAQAFVSRFESSRNKTDQEDSSSTPSTANAMKVTNVATRLCMICAGERKHPSCPVQCGHIFCWTCLHKWIQNRAKACPFCRTPCLSNDVVYLRNYA